VTTTVVVFGGDFSEHNVNIVIIHSSMLFATTRAERYCSSAPSTIRRRRPTDGFSDSHLDSATSAPGRACA